MLSVIELAQLLTGALDEKFNVSRTFINERERNGNFPEMSHKK
jgi:hypothetical protein